MKEYAFERPAKKYKYKVMAVSMSDEESAVADLAFKAYVKYLHGPNDGAPTRAKMLRRIIEEFVKDMGVKR